MCLSGCTPREKPEYQSTRECKRTIEKCPNQSVDTPLSETKKQAILNKLKESGKADDIVKAIEDGEIEMYEMNDAKSQDLLTLKHGKKINSENTLALRYGKKIYIARELNDAVAATHTAHEVTHVLDESPNKTKADILQREIKAFEKQMEVWEALKKKEPSLQDQGEDATLKFKKDGKLEAAIKATYDISEGI